MKLTTTIRHMNGDYTRWERFKEKVEDLFWSTEWFPPIYRFWKNKIKDPIRYDIPQGIQRLFIWFPIVWRDRDWDWTYLAIILRKKLQLMEHLEENHGHHTTSKKDAKNMRICIDLLSRLIEDGAYAWDKPGNYRHQSKARHKDLGDAVMYEDKMKKRDEQYLFSIMAKNWRCWWD